MTSDGGLLLVRELDERLGFGELIERHAAAIISTDSGASRRWTMYFPLGGLHGGLGITVASLQLSTIEARRWSLLHPATH